MLEEVTEIIGREVYTPNAIYLGTVKDVVIDLDTNTIYGLFIERPNPALVEGGISVSVPYRWVSSIGDIVVLRYFPKFVKTGVKAPTPVASPGTGAAQQPGGGMSPAGTKTPTAT